MRIYDPKLLARRDIIMALQTHFRSGCDLQQAHPAPLRAGLNASSRFFRFVVIRCRLPRGGRFPPRWTACCRIGGARRLRQASKMDSIASGDLRRRARCAAQDDGVVRGAGSFLKSRVAYFPLTFAGSCLASKRAINSLTPSPASTQP